MSIIFLEFLRDTKLHGKRHCNITFCLEQHVSLDQVPRKSELMFENLNFKFKE